MEVPPFVRLGLACWGSADLSSACLSGIRVNMFVPAATDRLMAA